MRRARLLGAAIGVALAAAACGSDDDSMSAATTTAPPATPAPATTAAPASTSTAASTTTGAPQPCGTGGDLTRPSQDRTFTTSTGVERTWTLALPSGYDESVPADVVFNLHGRGSNAAEQYVYGNFIEQAEADGVILVMPEALEIDGRRSWNPGEPGSGEDLDFLGELVDGIRTEYCTDRFFAAGMSSGGGMSSALGCWAEGPFEAFGPVTLAFYDADVCSTAGARPFVYFHGTDDDTVPFDGNDSGLDAAPVTAQEWADHNACDPDPVEERVSDEVVHFSWQGCDASTDFYVIEGGGHSWPGSLPIESLGYVTDDISASDIIWDVFFG